MHEIRNRFYESSFGRAFLVTLFFVTFASGLFWLDFFRSYETEISVLMVSRANKGENSVSISNNMAEIISTLAFYNRLIENSDTLDDEFASLTQDQKKEKWQSIVSLSKKNESGVLVIRVKGDTSERSKTLAEETARTLFATAGLYYNIDTDIDMRVIDGPIVSYSLHKPWLYVVMVLFSGLSVSSFFFFVLRMIPAFFSHNEEKRVFPDFFVSPSMPGEEKENHFVYESFDTENAPFIDPKKFVPEKPEALSFDRNIEEVPEIIESAHTKHSSAPANLPIAEFPFAEDESSLPFTFETPAVSEEAKYEEEAVINEEVLLPEVPEEAVEEEMQTISDAEPTVEDYKRRLNELLSDTTK